MRTGQNRIDMVVLAVLASLHEATFFASCDVKNIIS
jgi:hypothetical protein